MAPETLIYPLADGSILNGKYTILNVLNAGGFGITYLALDNEHSRYVVIKECMPTAYAYRDKETGHVYPHSEQTAGDFAMSMANSAQEAQVLNGLHHPGIVRVFDVFNANGTTYYVMENIQGQTLHDMKKARSISGQDLSPEQISTLLYRILDVLEYLHGMGIYHCDIKPGNIFIQADGTPKLIDFGAVRTKTLQHQGLVQVTPGYTPPEFYPGRRSEIGPWCDIYGLGATFYELLTKQVPIPADQRSVVDRNPKITTFAPLRELYPMNFLSAIDKAMATDERSRFYSAQAWRDYINNMASAGTLNTGTPGAVTLNVSQRNAGKPNAGPLTPIGQRNAGKPNAGALPPIGQRNAAKPNAGAFSPVGRQPIMRPTAKNGHSSTGMIIVIVIILVVIIGLVASQI